MDRFATEILPVVVRYASLALRCPDQQGLAITLAWWAWSTARDPDLPATVWARAGVRRVLSGRDLPGCGVSAKDALRRAESGGGMGEVADRMPGPLDRLVRREDLDRLHATYDGTKAEVLRRLEGGERTQDVAADLGVTPSRISQLRAEYRERLGE